MTKIIKNAVQCKKCGDIIESKHTHDYVTCKCGNVSVDGGKDYCKRSFKEWDSWIDMSEYEHKATYEVTLKEEDDNGKTL